MAGQRPCSSPGRTNTLRVPRGSAWQLRCPGERVDGTTGNPERSGGAAARVRIRPRCRSYGEGMPTPHDENTSSPSTRYEFRRVRIGRPAGGQLDSSAKPRPLQRLPRRNPREVLHLTVKHRGGPESWWEFHVRGTIVRRPGYTSLDDLFLDINNAR